MIKHLLNQSHNNYNQYHNVHKNLYRDDLFKP
jgi:hypothetical protein